MYLKYLLGVLQILVAVPGLRCPEACGILVPQPGIEPVSPALEGQFLTPGSPGKCLYHMLIKHLLESFSVCGHTWVMVLPNLCPFSKFLLFHTPGS